MGKYRKPAMVQCADCGSRMELRYVCVRRPKCQGSHGAHPNGRPMGEPADAETRRLRALVHHALNRWVERTGVTTEYAYKRLGHLMAIEVDECHVASFDHRQCRLALAVIKEQ